VALIFSYGSTLTTLPNRRLFLDRLQHAIAMSHTLGLYVVAEGVETEAQRAFLSENGCKIQQGYFYSKPVPVKELTKLVESCQGINNNCCSV
jgi:EAL domain-containing protein (putative c-di-GMP-specific phosphodiesterase class I)